MPKTLVYWAELYERFKYRSLCVDIETTGWNGPISVLGLYRPREGVVEHKALVRGVGLTKGRVARAFQECKLLVAYNGRLFDVPRIHKEFPGAIPKNVPVVDLYLFARRLNLNTGLKVLESTFHIDRINSKLQMRGMATRLWRRYEKYGDAKALEQLIEYNRQDTINLHPLAEKLVKLVFEKTGQPKALHPASNERGLPAYRELNA